MVFFPLQRNSFASSQNRIRYFQAGTKGPPLLLLHGFGVGAFHYERNIEALSKSCCVFAVDVLGQGEHKFISLLFRSDNACTRQEAAGPSALRQMPTGS